MASPPRAVLYPGKFAVMVWYYFHALRSAECRISQLLSAHERRMSRTYCHADINGGVVSGALFMNMLGLGETYCRPALRRYPLHQGYDRAPLRIDDSTWVFALDWSTASRDILYSPFWSLLLSIIGLYIVSAITETILVYSYLLRSRRGVTWRSTRSPEARWGCASHS